MILPPSQPSPTGEGGTTLRAFEDSLGSFPSPRGRGVRGEGIHLGCISRLSREKGIDVLIDAAKDMAGVSLTIVGSGREEPHIRTLINNLPHIRLLPSVSDLSAFYRSLDVVILPSRDNDPFGLVAAEAMEGERISM